MTDFSKLTDNQINERMQAFPNSMVLLDKKGKRKLIDYVADDGFCLRIVKENKLYIQPHYFDVTYWEVTHYYRDMEAKVKTHVGIHDTNLNRAILDCYLKLKDKTNE